MTNYYPLMINIKNKCCLVIGGGKVAYRKIRELLKYNAEVRLISREVSEEIQELIDNREIKFLNKEYNSSLLNKVFLVISATNNKELNKKVIEDCNEKNILVCSVDNPKESSFIQPSKIKKGDITIAVSTAGKSPILSKVIREKIYQLIDEAYVDYINVLGEFREKALLEINSEEKRKEFFFRITNEHYLNLIRNCGKKYAYDEINNIFKEYTVSR